MFQISTSAAPKAAVSALTVLAAMGASGVVAQAAPVELEPLQAARLTNSSYGYLAADWKDWKAETGNTQIGSGQRGYATWNINFGAGNISQALFRINPISASTSYGVPAGANVYLNLITDTWSTAAPKPYPDTDGPDVGTTVGTEFLTIPAPSNRPNGTMDLDVTSLLQQWQANPTMYHGIRVYVEAQRGGVYAPDDTSNGNGTTANLIIDQAATPEPTSLAFLGVGAVLGLRRRR